MIPDSLTLPGRGGLLKARDGEALIGAERGSLLIGRSLAVAVRGGRVSRCNWAVAETHLARLLRGGGTTVSRSVPDEAPRPVPDLKVHRCSGLVCEG